MPLHKLKDLILDIESKDGDVDEIKSWIKEKLSELQADVQDLVHECNDLEMELDEVTEQKESFERAYYSMNTSEDNLHESCAQRLFHEVTLFGKHPKEVLNDLISPQGYQLN